VLVSVRHQTAFKPFGVLGSVCIIARSPLGARSSGRRAVPATDQTGNALFARFIADIAQARPHPTIAQRTVGDVFVDEQARLLTLPWPLPEIAQVKPVAVNSQAFVHFDTNRYSVPSEYASSVVTLRADDVTVQLIDDAKLHLVKRHSFVNVSLFAWYVKW
jgi:hypothetical protein